MSDSHQTPKKQVDWTSPSGTLKFNVAEVPRGKPGPAGIRGHQGHTRLVFTESVGNKDSNEAELLSSRRTLIIGAGLGEENQWLRVIRQMPSQRLITTVREIRALVSGLEVSFMRISQTTNRVADFFAKNGVDGSVTCIFQLPGGQIVFLGRYFLFSFICVMYFCFFLPLWGLTLLGPI